LFGRRSERREVKKEDEERQAKKKKKAKRRGVRPQPKLPMKEKLHSLDAAELEGGCEKCGGDLEIWKGQFEESERITARRVVYEILVDKQQKYHCTSCKHIVTAPKPESFMPGGRYTEDLAVKVAVDKYCDSIPLNRQAQRMARRGLYVTSQTLWDQIERLYILLAPTLVVLHESILQAKLVYADETSWRMMRMGSTKKWWVWVLSDGEAVYFQIVPTRGNAAGRQLFKDYDGIVMADDYSVYNSLEKERTKQGGRVQIMNEDGTLITLPTPDYTLVSCWAHARRYIFNAARYHEEADEALDLIGKLYGVEREAKKEALKRVQLEREAGDLDADSHFQGYLEKARKRLRKEKSRPIIHELDAWRKAQSPIPGTALDEALAQLDRIWDRLLLSRSETGTRVAALFYSLISTCRLMRLDPHDYLIEATRRAIEDRHSVFLPHDFRKLLRETQRQSALRDDQDRVTAGHS